LEPYGIEPLTLEPCGLSYSLWLDVTAKGARPLQEMLRHPEHDVLRAVEARDGACPHVGSIMLTE
jgi:hypothetical protein